MAQTRYCYDGKTVWTPRPWQWQPGQDLLSFGSGDEPGQSY